eukprot:10898761-Alexandrium_andersonii.AAC.1
MFIRRLQPRVAFMSLAPPYKPPVGPHIHPGSLLLQLPFTIAPGHVAALEELVRHREHCGCAPLALRSQGLVAAVLGGALHG